VHRVFQAGQRHPRAAVVAQLDHLVLCQALQSLADHRARDLEFGGHLGFAQPFAGREPVLQHGAVDGIKHPVGGGAVGLGGRRCEELFGVHVSTLEQPLAAATTEGFS